MVKNPRKVIQITAVVFLIIAFAIMLHQWITWQHWFDLDQVLHHETFAISCAAIAITMLIVISIMPNSPTKHKKR